MRYVKVRKQWQMLSHEQHHIVVGNVHSVKYGLRRLHTLKLNIPCYVVFATISLLVGLGIGHYFCGGANSLFQVRSHYNA